MSEIAKKWTTHIIEQIPDSIRDSGHEVSESLDEIEKLIEIFDQGQPFDGDALNREMSELRNQLRGLSNLKGRAVKTRDNIVNQITIPNGWEYWFQSDPNEVLNTISGIRGNGLIEYESINFSVTEVDGVRLISGQGESLSWELTRVDLGSNPSVFVGSIPAWELDLCSGVPALEKKLNHWETSRRVRNPNRKRNHWQRNINQNNKSSIAAFNDKQENFFANPVIIHMPSDQYINIQTNEATNIAKIDVDLSFATNGAFDDTSISVIGEDLRPFNIIDGQHRIRGAASSIHNYGKNLLVVLLPKELSEDTAGRLFAEINTLSQALSDKHRMFLSHRFHVSSPDPRFSFGKWTAEDLSTHRDRANRMAYEMAANLMTLGNPLWDEKIKILDQNVKQQQVIGIEKWVEYTHPWFLDYPYTVASPLYSDWKQIIEEVDNYFEAWYKYLGESWENHNIDNCLFKSKTQSRVLLTRFMQVHELARKIQPEGLLTIDSFAQVLSPTTNIPFAHQSILQQFSSGLPDQSWKQLDAWVKDAIDGGIQKTRSEIMNSELRGIKGAGILALPIQSDSWHIEIDGDDGLDPSDGETRYVTIQRPDNCGYTCRPEIWHNGAKLNSKITVKSKKVENSENIPIRNRHPLPELDGQVILRIVWSTISGEEFKDTVIREPSEGV